MNKVHVIGAGISGFGCAHFLKKHGIESTIYEKNTIIGGRAASVQCRDLNFEIGGKNFSSGWTLFREILDHVGIGASEFDDQHPDFHILINNKLMGLSKSSTLRGGLALMNTIGIRGAVQLNWLLSISRKNKALFGTNSEELVRLEQKYDNKTIDKLFSKKLCYGPLRMFSIIMGAAEPSEMHMLPLMKFLSGFGGGSHHAIKGGLSRLFDALAKEHDVKLSTEVSKIHIEEGKIIAISIRIEGREYLEKASRVVLTLPLNRWKDVLDLPKGIISTIARVNYFPLIMVNAVYDKDVFTNDISSIMFDENYHLGHCSANRLYDLDHVRFTFSGQNSRELWKLGDQELIDLAEKEFSQVLPIKGKRIEYHVARHTDGLCGYCSHYSEVKKQLLDYIFSIEGLEVAGDFLEGHAMGDCLYSSKKAVDRLMAGQSLTV